MHRSYALRLAAVVLLSASVAVATDGQSVGNATTLNGTVVDATGAIVLGATVKIHNPVSGYDRSTETDTSGRFTFSNVPFNPYHLTVTSKGFSNYAQDVELRSNVPVTVTITLQATVEATTVTVRESAGDLVETDSTFHSDVDRNELERLPMPPESSGVAAAVTAETPGVSADSNNMMQGLGDHAENTISIDSQARSARARADVTYHSLCKAM
jgi:Carboxypeptidase regulatory-like domain